MLVFVFDFPPGDSLRPYLPAVRAIVLHRLHVFQSELLSFSLLDPLLVGGDDAELSDQKRGGAHAGDLRLHISVHPGDDGDHRNHGHHSDDHSY